MSRRLNFLIITGILIAVTSEYTLPRNIEISALNFMPIIHSASVRADVAHLLTLLSPRSSSPFHFSKPNMQHIDRATVKQTYILPLQALYHVCSTDPLIGWEKSVATFCFCHLIHTYRACIIANELSLTIVSIHFRCL